MIETTTVRVAVSTRDRIMTRAAERGQTADQVIQDGLRALDDPVALDRAARYELMREESRAALKAEMQAVREDMARLVQG